MDAISCDISIAARSLILRLRFGSSRWLEASKLRSLKRAFGKARIWPDVIDDIDPKLPSGTTKS